MITICIEVGVLDWGILMRWTSIICWVVIWWGAVFKIGVVNISSTVILGVHDLAERNYDCCQ